MILLILWACARPAPAPDDDTAVGTACAALSGEFIADPYGGDSRLSLDATGWFRTEQVCDRWWLVTPEGHPFASLGVNATSPHGSTGVESGRDVYAENVDATYADDGAWADATVTRLSDWGWNTAGAWSDTSLLAPRMASTPILYLSGSDWQTGEVADWWSPEWEDSVQDTVDQVVLPWADEPHIIGWFLDNEITWGPDWRGLQTLLQRYLAKPADAPGKVMAVDLLLDELGDVEAVNLALGTAYADRAEMLADQGSWDGLSPDATTAEAALTTAFLQQAATRYFGLTVATVRAADPHHMVLGNREVGVLTRVEPYLAAAPLVDVLSVNNYTFVDGVAEAAMSLSGGLDPSGGLLALHQALDEAELDRPLLITEFSFRADDSGLPNSWPPIYPTLDTQTQRAEAFADYARAAQQAPWIVGYHWFRWVDEPTDGRFDGEDSNFGLVTEGDAPYTTLVETTAAVNAEYRSLLEAPQ